MLEGYVTRDACPLCGGGRHRPKERYDRWPDHEIVKCLDCGLWFCLQVPDEKTYEEQYRDFFGYLDESSDHIERLREVDAQSPGLKLEVHELVAGLLAEKRGGSVLDIGCAIGVCSDHLKAAGFKTHCIEVSAPLVEFLREKGHDAVMGPMESAGLAPESFDAAVMLEVLEHLVDPLGQLREVHRVLKPGGLLVVEVPNLFFHLIKGKIEKSAPFGAVVKKPVYGLQPNVHLSYFSKKTLGLALRRAGFVDASFFVKPYIKDRAVTAEKYPRYLNEALRNYTALSDFLLRRFGLAVSNALIAVCRKPG